MKLIFQEKLQFSITATNSNKYEQNNNLDKIRNLYEKYLSTTNMQEKYESVLISLKNLKFQYSIHITDMRIVENSRIILEGSMWEWKQRANIERVTYERKGPFERAAEMLFIGVFARGMRGYVEDRNVGLKSYVINPDLDNIQYSLRGDYNPSTNLYVVAEKNTGKIQVYNMADFTYVQYNQNAGSATACKWYNTLNFGCGDTNAQVAIYNLSDINQNLLWSPGGGDIISYLVLKNGNTVVGDENSDMHIGVNGIGTYHIYTPGTYDVLSMAEVRDNLVISLEENIAYLCDWSIPSLPTYIQVSVGAPTFQDVVALKEGNGHFAIAGRHANLHSYISIFQLLADKSVVSKDTIEMPNTDNYFLVLEFKEGFLVTGGYGPNICIWKYISPQSIRCFDKELYKGIRQFIPAPEKRFYPHQ